ncbi:methionyl-tRNA formyltransferase [bacterium]|nr:methionyl-tRNA formyltransferase [bacterium]MBU1599170.1 methionyl-tRNA formyltransferase [bacterium]MBU2462385.1 methionyl-tRNA formyltransferase [bacterium]
MEIIFAGTSEFATPSLKRLARNYPIRAVFTLPAKPKGRHLKLQDTPVAILGKELSLTVFEQDNIPSNYVKGADLLITVSFGRILRPEVITAPRFGSINLHPSLLPKYRGPAPIPWTIIQGEKETGLTVYWMDEGVDSGPIILQERVDISEEDDAGSLSSKLAEIGAEVLLKAMKMIAAEPKSQEGEPSYAPKIETREIDWKRKNTEITNLIRGLSPHPSAYTHYGTERIKILKSVCLSQSGPPGEILSAQKDGLIVGCTEGSLLITSLHPENRKVVPAISWWCGVKNKNLYFNRSA